MNVRQFLVSLALLGSGVFSGCSAVVDERQPTSSMPALQIKHIASSDLFDSPQKITVLSMENPSDRYVFRLVHDANELHPTSYFARREAATAAVNGGFFDMDEGGSVTYFEVDDVVLSRGQAVGTEWSKPQDLVNGAIVISKDNRLRIELALAEQVYEKSKEEMAVLVTGPVLLLGGAATTMPTTEFVTKRHPRTCICTTPTEAILVVIDGRQKDAAGMSLYEVQQYLKTIGCVDAINLDGGGSTTMWLHDKGVINTPSETSGERPVANVLLLIEQD